MISALFVVCKRGNIQFVSGGFFWGGRAYRLPVMRSSPRSAMRRAAPYTGRGAGSEAPPAPSGTAGAVGGEVGVTAADWSSGKPRPRRVIAPAYTDHGSVLTELVQQLQRGAFGDAQQVHDLLAGQGLGLGEAGQHGLTLAAPAAEAAQVPQTELFQSAPGSGRCGSRWRGGPDPWAFRCRGSGGHGPGRGPCGGRRHLPAGG